MGDPIIDIMCGDMDKLRNKINRLSTELAEAKERLHVRKETMVAMKDRLSLVETENARLREALGEILKNIGLQIEPKRIDRNIEANDSPLKNIHVQCPTCLEHSDIATIALNGGDDNK